MITAGEAIFFLPFILTRIFRPTLLDVFGINNYELGQVFSIYGIIAMIVYLPSGFLADAFNPRKLLTIALLSTAIGGVVMMAIPSILTLKLLYAYWGVTTIALFWASLMRATRELGGEMSQGFTFGLLDGGRGLLAAVAGSIIVIIYTTLIPENVREANIMQRREALQNVILVMSLITLSAGTLVWFVLPKGSRSSGKSRASKINFKGVKRVFKMRTMWLQAFIIICAYVGFKSTDDFSLYANQVLKLDEIESAKIGTLSLYMRPIAAILAGYFADKTNSASMTILSFILLAMGSLMLGFNIIHTGVLWLFLISIVCASLGIFALRGLYYAIMKEGKIPLAFTGSAVGLVSVIGYTPDIFMGPVMGYLLDSSPGKSGHQNVFLIVLGFSIAGLIASVAFRHITKKPNPS